MHSKTVVSSKGQVVIPKPIREAMGLHPGSEMTMILRNGNTLEFKHVQREIADFFGMGAETLQNAQNQDDVSDIDEAIIHMIA